jgi:hypothetical protein
LHCSCEFVALEARLILIEGYDSALGTVQSIFLALTVSFADRLPGTVATARAWAQRRTLVPCGRDREFVDDGVSGKDHLPEGKNKFLYSRSPQSETEKVRGRSVAPFSIKPAPCHFARIHATCWYA